eukprot:6108464-Prymnesium_polylepis.2
MTKLHPGEVQPVRSCTKPIWPTHGDASALGALGGGAEAARRHDRLLRAAAAVAAPHAALDGVERARLVRRGGRRAGTGGASAQRAL